MTNPALAQGAAAHVAQCVGDDCSISFAVGQALVDSYIAELKKHLSDGGRQGRKGGLAAELRSLASLSITFLTALELLGQADLRRLDNFETLASTVEFSIQKAKLLGSTGRASVYAMLTAARAAARNHFYNVYEKAASEAKLTAEPGSQHRLRYNLLYLFVRSLAMSLCQEFGILMEIPRAGEALARRHLAAVLDAALAMTKSVESGSAQKTAPWDVMAATLDSYESKFGGLEYKSLLIRALDGARIAEADEVH